MDLIAVIGSGRMAPGIAAACLKAGAEVRILGRARERAAASASAAAELHGSGSGRVTAGEITGEQLAGAALVIETISEQLEPKRELLARVEAGLSAEAVIATNTSSLRIADLATALGRPERFLGLHFLNPADCTPVVEVIAGPRTSEPTLKRAIELGRAMGKEPILARKDVPGFVWNRIQFAVLRECLHLLEEDVADIATLDAAVSDGLAPRWAASGPLASADLGGLETFATIAEELYGELAASSAPQRALSDRAAAGTNFYAWTEQTVADIASLRRRLIGEAAERLDERREATPDTADS